MSAHRPAARRPTPAPQPRPAEPVPLLKDGLRHQQAGDLAQAALVYRAVIRREPGNAMARTLLGLTLCQGGEHEQGLRTIREAIGLDNDAFAWFSLGQALSELGRPAEAVPAFQASLAALPTAAATHAALGDALRSLDQPGPAAEAYRAAVALAPGAASYRSLGRMLRRLERNAEAVLAFRAGLALDQTDAASWSSLANVLVALGRPHEAVTAAHLAIGFDANLADAHFNLANALRATGQRKAALAAYRAALARQPVFPEAACNLSAALYADWAFSEAEAAAELAIAQRPNYPEALTNLANALQGQLRLAEAEAVHRRVLALGPSAAAHSNLAIVLTTADRLDEALAEQRRALALSPDFADALYNHGVTLLKAGEYAQGWRYYEQRWQMPWSPPRPFAEPQWQGEALEGRTILLHPEQGLGDTLMMARFAPLVAAFGGRVVLEAQKPLVRLLRCLPGVAEVVALGDKLPEFDIHCPMFSLPRVLATTLANLPNSVYLHADPALAEAWRGRMVASDHLRVGLVWRGAEKIGPDVNRERSIDPARLAPLADVPGVDYYSLQKYEAGALISPPPPGMTLHDFTADFADFADTAALVAQLDLVIAVDTSTAHLAAGMGKPVWLLSRYGGCWRWMAHRSDSPWYPSLTVFRQPRPTDWAPAVAQIEARLRHLVAARSNHGGFPA